MRLIGHLFHTVRLTPLFLSAPIFLFACISLPASAQHGAGTDWPAYGGDAGSTRYSALDQINAANVRNLEVAWIWKADSLLPNAQTSSQTTPLMVNGVLYFSMDQRRYVIAADAGTGETLWIYRPDEGARFEAAPRKIHRGVSWWSDGKGDDRIVFATPGFQLIALDAHTGHPVESFGNAGIVDMLEALDLDFQGDMLGRLGNSSPVVIANDTIVIGAAMGRLNKVNAKGDVLAFDARTGQRRWAFHTIPRSGEFGYESWLNGSAEYTGNAGVWGPFSVDPELNLVYLAVEAPTNDVYGGARHGDNLFSSTLVAVDLSTGVRKWHFQMVHHDIWDYDNPAHPILVDLVVDGKPVRAVVQVTKQAYAYVFNRETGEPVWPIIETPVPQTSVPGERTSLTQPIPSKPPGFDVQGITDDDLVDFNASLKLAAKAALEHYTTGPMYTPPSLASDTNIGTYAAPGYGGGANWTSGGADPETGYVYVSSTTNPSVIGLSPVLPTRPDDPDYADYRMTGDAPKMPGNIAPLKPPYGRITAYNMNQGEIAWQVPNGATPPDVQAQFDALGLSDIPATGSRSQAGLLITKSLLIAGEGTRGQPVLHAYDKHTGASLWSTPMPSGPQSGLPMTYLHEGRQYIVMAVNGNAPGQSGNAAQLVAWRLKD